MSLAENYKAQREELETRAQALIDENKADEAQNVLDEIKKLDEEFENAAKIQANLNSIKDKPAVNFQNIQKPSQKAPVIDNFTHNDVKDEVKLYETAFAKNLMGQPLNTLENEIFDKVNLDFKNAAQTTEQHGVLVPKTVQEKIFRKISELHPVLADVTGFGVKGDLTFIVDEATTDAANKDLWTNEATETPDSKDANFKEITLSGCELVKGTTLSWKLKKMSIDDFLNYVIEKLSEKMGNALAYAFFNGKGKPGDSDSFKAQPLGVITALSKETSTPRIVTYTDTDDLEVKVRNTIAKVKSGYGKLACIYANNDFVWNTLANIKDKNGRAYFVTDYNSGGVGRIFGLIVKEEDAVPNDNMVIGAFKKCYTYNTNEPMSITSQDETRKRQTFYSAYSIIDGAPLDLDGFALLKKAQS